MSVNPSKRFGIPVDVNKDYAVFELSEQYEIDSRDFLSKGRSTPYQGKRVYGKCVKTVINGGTVWKDVTIAK